MGIKILTRKQIHTLKQMKAMHRGPIIPYFPKMQCKQLSSDHRRSAFVFEASTEDVLLLCRQQLNAAGVTESRIPKIDYCRSAPSS